MSRWSRVGLWKLALLPLLAQLTALTYRLEQTRGTEVHGLAHDGLLYARASVFWARLLPASVEPSFAYQMISLLSLFSLGGLIAFALRGWGVQTLSFAALLVWGLLGAEGWREPLFQPGPTLLFAALVAAAAHFTFEAWRDAKSQAFWAAAVLWGMALATRFSGVIFLPFVMCSFAPRPWKRHLGAAALTALAYVLLGFTGELALPESLTIFLDPGETGRDWLLVYKDLMFFPLLVVLVGTFGHRRFDRVNASLVGRACLLAFGPFALLMAFAPHTAAPMLPPLIAVQTVLLAHLAELTAARPALPARVSFARDAVLVVLLLAFFMWEGALPAGV